MQQPTAVTVLNFTACNWCKENGKISIIILLIQWQDWHSDRLILANYNLYIMEYPRENTIAFNSYNEHFILSNMYPCTLYYKDMLFYGVDHLYHYLLFYRNSEVQTKIMKKAKGINANFIAKKIAQENEELIKDITPRQRHNLLKKCIGLKAQQCRQFKEYLTGTGDKNIVEFAWWGDEEYGCILKDNRYIGENVTGRIMEEIRKEIIN